MEGLTVCLLSNPARTTVEQVCSIKFYSCQILISKLGKLNYMEHYLDLIRIRKSQFRTIEHCVEFYSQQMQLSWEGLSLHKKFTN